MKLCICISCQLRGNLDNLFELKHNIESLPKEIETKVIFSLWDQSGFKITGSRGFHDAKRIFSFDVVKIIPHPYYGIDFWKYFPRIYKRLSSSETYSSYNAVFSIFPEAIIDIEKELLYLKFSERKNDNNSMKMLYKIW